MRVAEFHRQLELTQGKKIEWVQETTAGKLYPPGCYFFAPYFHYKEWVNTAFRNYLAAEREVYLLLPTTVCRTHTFHEKIITYADIGFIDGTVVNTNVKYDNRPKILCHFKPLPAKTSEVFFT